MEISADHITTTVRGGPIANRGYDQLRLTVDHEVILPDGTTTRLPAGTILIMAEAGGGYDQFGGGAHRAPDLAPASHNA